MAAKQLVDTPANTDSYEYKQLGYIQARDAVLHGEYAYVAYKESAKGGGAWRVYIKSNNTAGGSFEPDAIEKQAAIADDNGNPFFVWGFNMTPSADDARHVEFRVHVKDARPSEIEIYLRMRKGDGSAAEAKSIKFPWPA